MRTKLRIIAKYTAYPAIISALFLSAVRGETTMFEYFSHLKDAVSAHLLFEVVATMGRSGRVTLAKGLAHHSDRES